MRKSTKVQALLFAAVLPAIPAQAAMTHRYSFNEAFGGVATDSISGANGTLENGALLTGTGSVFMGNADNTNNVLAGKYVNLPNNISKTTNVSYEGWATWNGGNQWSRIFDFGTNTGGEENPGSGVTGYTGNDYVFVSPRQGVDGGNGRNDNFGSEIRLGGASNFASDQQGAAFDFNRGPNIAEHHFALTIKGGAGGNMTLYRDGVQVGTTATNLDPAAIDQVNNWLGRSNWQGDPFYNGLINEFRIYNETLTAAQVAASFAAGPNAVVPEPSALAAASLATLALLRRRGLRR